MQLLKTIYVFQIGISSLNQVIELERVLYSKRENSFNDIQREEAHLSTINYSRVKKVCLQSVYSFSDKINNTQT